MTDITNDEVTLQDNNLRFSLKGMIIRRLPELMHGEYFTPEYLFGEMQWHVLTDDEQCLLYEQIEELSYSGDLPFDQEITTINNTPICLYIRNDEEEVA